MQSEIKKSLTIKKRYYEKGKIRQGITLCVFWFNGISLFIFFNNDSIKFLIFLGEKIWEIE